MRGALYHAGINQQREGPKQLGYLGGSDRAFVFHQKRGAAGKVWVKVGGVRRDSAFTIGQLLAV
jgi:hypothetical protein